ncbi:MAG: hypothetical protein WBM12_14245 [Pseudolabrys sp.]
MKPTLLDDGGSKIEYDYDVWIGKVIFAEPSVDEIDDDGNKQKDPQGQFSLATSTLQQSSRSTVLHLRTATVTVKCRPARMPHFRSVVTDHMPPDPTGIIAIDIIGTAIIDIGTEREREAVT